MEMEFTAWVTVALMFISYQIGNLIGKSEAHHAGFIEGASAGIDKILHVLRKEYGIIVGYDDIVVKSEEEKAE